MDEEDGSDDPHVSAWFFATVVCVVLAIVVAIITVVCCCVRKRMRPSSNKGPVILPPLPDNIIGPKEVIQPAVETHPTTFSPSHSILKSPSVSTVQPNAEIDLHQSPGMNGFDTVSVRPRSTSWSSLAGNPVHRPHRSLSREDHSLRSSIYSRLSSAEAVGRLHFSLKYDFHSSDLTITVIECQELEKRETGRLPSPCVRVQLSPNCDVEHETRVQEESQSPQFNETFVFSGVQCSSLSTRTVHFEVLDCDKSKQHRLMGELDFSLPKADLYNENDLWLNITLPGNQARGGLGEILFALSYLPTAGRLTVINVVVMKAKSLKAMTVTKNANPYAKVSFLVDGKRIEKRKTAIMSGTLYPVWNASCQFSVAIERLKSVSLVVSVMHNDRLGRNRGVGQVEVGPSCKAHSPGHQHWSDMLASPRHLIAMWHPLESYTKLPRW